MCPGCGEPLAVRQFLETIDELDVAQRAIAVAGIGCYTSFSGTMDVDLVQALHGRAPSVATGVKRMLPDALVFTLQGDGDMVNEGLQEVHPHRGARRERHVHPVEQRRVRRDRRPHDRHERDRPAHEELARRPRRRVPRLPDPHRRPHRAAPGRGVRRARLGAQRGLRSRARGRCSSARSRRSSRGEGFSFVEVLTMCPTGWFIPTAEGPDYMHRDARRGPHHGRAQGRRPRPHAPRSSTPRTSPSQRELDDQLARGGLEQVTRGRPTHGLPVPGRGRGVPHRVPRLARRQPARRPRAAAARRSLDIERRPRSNACARGTARSPTRATRRSRGPRNGAAAARA